MPDSLNLLLSALCSAWPLPVSRSPSVQPLSHSLKRCYLQLGSSFWVPFPQDGTYRWSAPMRSLAAYGASEDSFEDGIQLYICSCCPLPHGPRALCTQGNAVDGSPVAKGPIFC